LKLLTIVGARPQFIKAAIVSAAVKQAQINEIGSPFGVGDAAEKIVSSLVANS
jgi:hypothetical protein